MGGVISVLRIFSKRIINCILKYVEIRTPVGRHCPLHIFASAAEDRARGRDHPSQRHPRTTEKRPLPHHHRADHPSAGHLPGHPRRSPTAGLPAVETEQTEQDEIPLSATGDRPQFALDDFAGLQDRLLSTLFGSVFGPSSDSGRPLASLPSEQPSFFPPSLSNLPPNYENSSTREEEIDGHKVRIDETIHKKKTPLGSSVFHLKVYQINPDGSVSEREQPKARPATEKPIEQEQVTMKIPEAGKEDIPTITLNEPKEETPVVKEFGPVVDNGRGVEEQIPDVSQRNTIEQC